MFVQCEGRKGAVVAFYIVLRQLQLSLPNKHNHIFSKSAPCKVYWYLGFSIGFSFSITSSVLQNPNVDFSSTK